MITLTGSEKQIAWATTIRSNMIKSIEYLLELNLNSGDSDDLQINAYKKQIEVIGKIPFSDWFIDNFSRIAVSSDSKNYQSYCTDVAYQMGEWVYKIKVAKKSGNKGGVILAEIHELNLI